MKQNIRKFMVLILLIAQFSQGYAEEDITVDQLNIMKEKGMISQEDYDILIADISGILENEELYKLNINGVLIDDKFKVLLKGDTMYFPVFRFFELLGFFNLKQTQDEAIASLNDGLTVILNKNKQTITLPKNKDLMKKIANEENYIFRELDEYFLREDIFKDIFLNYLSVEKRSATIKMSLSFNTPEEATILFNLRQEDIKKELEKYEIIYMNNQKFFEIGNARLQICQNFDKAAGENGYKKDWEGFLEYQGAFLYGNLTTSYDFKEKQVGDIEIEYEDMIKDHNLKVGGYQTTNDSREFGFSLRKDKGYYELGKKFIISENVPIGSKVELIYMGYPIEVKEAENGKVTFDNNLIRSDRSYQLKIYTPNGDTETRYIDTAQNYNQQNKGEIEYNILFREDYESKKYHWDARAYYGITSEFTIGLGNKRAPEKINKKYNFLDEGRLELTYTDQIYNGAYPITLRIGNDHTFTKGEDDNNKKYSERYKYDGLAQVNINNWRLKTELDEYGKFYEEKSKYKYEIEYSGFNNLTFGYEYEIKDFGNGRKEDENKYKIYYDKGLTTNLLLSSEVRINDKKDEEYRLEFFYTGFSNFNINWKNLWKKNITDYETELEMYSNDFYGIIDYSFSIKYSEQLKERASLSFTIDYENFLKITGEAGEKGRRSLKAGIDRVIDLKNIKASIDNIDSSRIKVISFIDGNDNNIYDEGETRIDNVEVKIGNQNLVTNDMGEAIFYGVSNDMLINLQPRIRKPSYSLGKNIIKVKGRATSTIEAYIPVKPMLTLNGSVELDKSLKLSPESIQSLYSEILIRVKDIKGNEIELTMPDETGHFMVSGIFPDKYFLEIKYTGDKFNLPELKEKLELVYINNFSPKVVLNITDEKFSLNKFLKGETQ